MIREKGGYRMSLSVTGESRADCIGQLNKEFFPHHIEGVVPPKKVALTKLELVRLLKKFVGDTDCREEGYSLLMAKKLVEKEFPQLDYS